MMMRIPIMMMTMMRAYKRMLPPGMAEVKTSKEDDRLRLRSEVLLAIRVGVSILSYGLPHAHK